MWRVTIIANPVMMVLFYLMSILSISIADNRFLQYAESTVDLPMPTSIALSVQVWTGVIPLSWFILSYLIWRKIKGKQPEVRNEILLAFTTSTIAIGCTMLVFFALAGILPFLYIRMIAT
jgi:uncharacterized membrane protein YbhN (UPF0104 family)